MCIPGYRYEFAFNPSSAAASYVSRVKTIQDPDVFVTDVTARMAELTEIMRTGKHVDKVEEQLGRGIAIIIIILHWSAESVYYELILIEVLLP